MSKFRERRTAREWYQQRTQFQASYEEFKRFLEQNLNRRFDMDSSYDCAGAACVGYPLNEVYMGPEWFNAFQRKAHRGTWTGRGLLSVLREVDPSPIPRIERRWRSK